MLTQAPGPRILSDACFQYSAFIDVNAFDPESTPGALGILLPRSLLNAAKVRQAEYLAGRFAARTALKAAGCMDPGEIASNPDRSPQWPDGYVGSITHTNGYVSAVVASSARVIAIGRDSERILTDENALEIQKVILRPEEVERRVALGLGAGEYVGLIFSAKESFYKALAPIVKRTFGFQDAQVVEISRDSGSLRLRLERDLGKGFGPGFELQGRFEMAERIHTAVEWLGSQN
jgi:enterobactin synthetase component D